jgi:hypothetical protein
MSLDIGSQKFECEIKHLGEAVPKPPWAIPRKGFEQPCIAIA